MKRTLLLVLSVLLTLGACTTEEFSPLQTSQPAEQTSDLLRTAPMATRAIEFDRAFTRSGNGWTGGDATYSVALPDGRVVWIFGDSFLGKVNADRSRPLNSPFVNNTLMLQKGAKYLGTLYQGTEKSPEAFVSPSNPDEWYWPADGTVANNKLYLFLTTFHSTGGGAFGFEFLRTDLGIYSLPSMTLEQIIPFSPNPTTIWGAAVMEGDSELFIYGSEDTPNQKYIRVSKLNLRSSSLVPLYYAGNDVWSKQETDGVRVFSGNSNQFSVFRHKNGQLYMVTQGNYLSANVYAYDMDTPVGPFLNKRLLFKTDPPVMSNNIFTYNAFVHTEFTRPDGAILVSYNVNTLKFEELYENADTYRPYFMWVGGWE